METIEIEGVIGWDVTSAGVKRQLREIGDADEILVEINSPGGYIDPGFGIYTALKNHPAQIHMHVTGLAASMGSVLLGAADRVTIEPTAMVMIHPPANIVWGTAKEMRAEADTLDKYESRAVKAYQRLPLTLDSEQLAEAIADTTWYTAEEAVDAGFAAEISDGSPTGESEISNTAVQWLRLAAYENMPEQLATLVKPNKTKKTQLSSKLIFNPDCSAVDQPTEGNDMTEEVTLSKADHEAAVQSAVDANDQKWKTIINHLDIPNAEAIALIGSMNVDAEQCKTLLDAVAVKAEAAPEKVVVENKTDEDIDPAMVAKVMKMMSASGELDSVNRVAHTDHDTEDKKEMAGKDILTLVGGA